MSLETYKQLTVNKEIIINILKYSIDLDLISNTD